MFEKYTVVIKTMWLTTFYAPLIPIGPVLSMAGLIIFYWCEKYLFARRYKRPPPLGTSLNYIMLINLEFVPLILSAGNIVFHCIVYQINSASYLIPDILSLIISSIFLVIPSEKLNSLFKKNIHE